MLKLEHIYKKYKLKHKVVCAVNDVSLEFHKGEFVSILGLSGSGKTTLVSQIGGLDTPTEGKLSVNGVDTTSFKTQDWNNYRKNNIGFIFQDFNLITHLTAKENIEISLSLSGLSSEEKSKRADELLELMGISDQKDQLPKQLSGGQKQRVAIARALSNEPDIILADEPTGALDPDTAVQIMEILQSLAKKGHLVIMVTHDKYIARDYSTRIVKLEGGEVVSNDEIRPCTTYKDEELSTDKSSLQFLTAVKIAFNNLKLRKKSSIFSLISLIPSMILIYCIMNLVFNIGDYQKDFKPILGDINNREDMLYLSPYTDNDLETTQKLIYKEINRWNLFNPRIEPFKNQLVEAYPTDEMKAIESIDGVKKVLRGMYFNIRIGEESYILVALPPKEYADYQFAIDKKYYPDDDEEGLIMTKQALDRLSDMGNKKTGQSIDFSLYNYMSVPIKLPTIIEKKNRMQTQILSVVDKQPKTTIAHNYYGEHIYISYGYAKKIRDTFTLDDFTLFAYNAPDPFEPPKGIKVGDFYVSEAQSLSDPVASLRMQTSLQEKYGLLQFKEFNMNMKANNYSLKYTIITDDNFNKKSLEQLKGYGDVSNSRYERYAVESAKKTDSYITYTLFGATGVAMVIILIPTLLVCLILYISIILRTKEIGILKSIGARNKDILNIFTLESGMLAISSGLVSLIIALPIMNVIRDVLEDKYNLEASLGSNPMMYNVGGIVTGFLLSVGLITVIGMLPGRKASKLQPNTLLKHE